MWPISGYLFSWQLLPVICALVIKCRSTLGQSLAQEVYLNVSCAFLSPPWVSLGGVSRRMENTILATSKLVLRLCYSVAVPAHWIAHSYLHCGPTIRSSWLLVESLCVELIVLTMRVPHCKVPGAELSEGVPYSCGYLAQNVSGNSSFVQCSLITWTRWMWPTSATNMLVPPCI